jgi:hypothetical protein
MAAQAAKRAIGPLAAIIGLAWGKEGRTNGVILENVPKKVGVEPPDFLSDPDKALILSFIDYGYNTKRGFGGEFLVSTAMSKLEKQLSNPEKIAEMRRFNEQFSEAQQEELKNFILELGLSKGYIDKVFNDLSSIERPSASPEQMLENARKKTLPELQALINSMKNADSPEEQAIIQAAQEKARKQQNNSNSVNKKQNNTKAEPSKSFSLFDPSSWGLVFGSSVGLSSNTSSKNSSNNSRNNRQSWTNMTRQEQNQQVNKWGNVTSPEAKAGIAAAQATVTAAATSENNNNNNNNNNNKNNKNIGPSGDISGFGANFGGRRKTRRGRKQRRRSTQRKH